MEELEELESGKSFVVCTFHAPTFINQAPNINSIMIDLFFHSVENFSQELPVFVLGDLNIFADSQSYQLITSPNKAESEIEVSKEKYVHQPKMKKQFKSAYLELYNKEPKFTCKTHFNIKDFGDSEGTVDYIFFANLEKVKIDFEKISEEPLYYPTQDNQSDHLPLRATFHF